MNKVVILFIKGAAKSNHSQEKRIDNILYVNKTSNYYSNASQIKSVSNQGFQSSRNNTITLNRMIIKPEKQKETQTPEDEPEDSDEFQMGSGSTLKSRRIEYRIAVRILGIEIKLPLSVVYRALGFVTDSDIYKTIVYDSDEPSLKARLYDALLPSFKDGQPIYDQRAALI